MDIDPALNDEDGSAKKKRPGRNTVIPGLLQLLDDNHSWSAKQFIEHFFDSKTEKATEQREAWGNPRGWESTKRVLECIKKLVYSAGAVVVREKYEEWIFGQVS